MKVIKNLEYVSRNGTGLCLDLHLPAEGNGLSAVVMGLPGGGWRNCAKESVPLFLVDHGFAMACINYRVSDDATAPANIQDCKTAISWIRENAERYGLDPDRIGVYGASAGGHLAALLGASGGVEELEGSIDANTGVQAVCAVCGPMDLTRMAIPEVRERFPVLCEVTEKYLGGPVHDQAEMAKLVSPLTYVSQDCPPMLLIHGNADDVVPEAESRLFHEALERAGAKSTLHVLEGAGHGWLDEQTAPEVHSFFKEALA